MTTPLARTERDDLCTTASAVGPDAPTLCGDWTVRELLAHLHVREKRPLAAAGILVPALSGVTDRAMARAADREFADLVARVRTPGLTPFAIPPLEVVINTLEYLVHHEDIRRAQPGWEPRELTRAQLDAAWKALGRAGRMLARSAGVPISITRTDTDQTRSLVAGAEPVTVSGPVVELVLFFYGRDQWRDLRFDGPDDTVATVRAATFGL